MPKGIYKRTNKEKERFLKIGEKTRFQKGNKINLGRKFPFRIRNRTIVKICPICGNTFSIFKSQENLIKRCSMNCRKKYLSEIMKGNQYAKGFIPTEKQLANLCRKSGKEHWNWKDGITPLVRQIRNCLKYCQWRLDVFTKDDFTCQKCGIRNKVGLRKTVYLEADHYPKSFSKIIEENNIRTFEEALICEELWDVNGGRTLCKKCHNKTKRGNPHKQNAKNCLYN